MTGEVALDDCDIKVARTPGEDGSDPVRSFPCREVPWWARLSAFPGLRPHLQLECSRILCQHPAERGARGGVWARHSLLSVTKLRMSVR